MIIQLCGLSGSGKTTIATEARTRLEILGHRVIILDGDAYRRSMNKDLGFSRADRLENIRRLGVLASQSSSPDDVAIISAINPYEEARAKMVACYPGTRTIWIRCALPELIRRDTKGLYKRALLADNHPDKLHHLTGVNDPFEAPSQPDLVIDTEFEQIDQSVGKFMDFLERLGFGLRRG